MPDCNAIIQSNDFYDFLVPLPYEQFKNEFADNCIIPIGQYDSVIYVNKEQALELNYSNYVYTSIPKCYGLMDVDALNAAGVYQIQNQPFLNLKGQGVMIGVIDTGIDYRNDVFRLNDGTSRIQAIWDQSAEVGTPPEGFLYGAEYSRAQLNIALAGDDPLAVVPETDTIGHGTRMAAIAAGNTVMEEQFSGAAPEATLAVVKIKPAKQYLRDFYFIPEGVPAYQENDLILAAKYLVQLAASREMPLVICIGLGTSMGGHEGFDMLDRYLQNISKARDICVVIPSGNEANTGHHFSDTQTAKGESQDVELRVGENVAGFQMELWASVPDEFSIAVTSPGGEKLPRVPAITRQGTEYSFIFEETTLRIDYQFAETRAGSEVIIIRFTKPTPGIWTIQVYGNDIAYGRYHIWLPISSFLSQDTYFLRSTPETTYTSPAAARDVLSVGGYNSINGSNYIDSGRGFSPSGRVCPVLVAPAVNIRTVAPDNRFTTATGTSLAAGIAAGAAALLFQWNKKRQGIPIDSVAIIDYLIRGAERAPGNTYPSPTEGFGRLDLEGTFESLRID